MQHDSEALEKKMIEKKYQPASRINS